MFNKLFACDLDGTLLDDKSAVSKESFSTIEQLYKNHILFVPVTGRTLHEIPAEINDCPFINYIIYSDGAVIFNKLNKKSLTRYIDNSTVKRLFKLLSKYDTMIELYHGGHPVTDSAKLNEEAYSYYRIDPNYRPVITKTRIGVDYLQNYIENINDVEIFNVFFRYPDERRQCISILKSYKTIDFTTSMDNNLEIMRSDVSKGTALERLCNSLNIKPADTICAGDSKNDTTMFSFCKTAVATANASDSVKAVADIVGCSNNDGIVGFVAENCLGVKYGR